MITIILIAIIGLTLIGTTTAKSICYQESTDTSNQTGIDSNCAQIYNGTIVGTGTFSIPHPLTNMNDGDWSTNTESGSGNIYFYINYTKPTWAYSTGTKWQVRDKPVSSSVNLTLPSSCVGNTLQFKVSIIPVSNQINFSCYNGTDFELLTTIAAYQFSDEAVFWNVTTPKPTYDSLHGFDYNRTAVQFNFTNPTFDWSTTQISVSNRTDLGVVTLLYSVNTTSNTFSMTNLTMDTHHLLKISSFGLDGNQSSEDTIGFSTLDNSVPVITPVFPSTSPYNFSENETHSLEVNVTDSDDSSIIVTWFKDAVNVFTETIVSGGTSVWSWITGYDSEGEYNITIIANDTYETSSSYMNITINDTYPSPVSPISVISSSKYYEYSIPLVCEIDFVPLSPFVFEWVYSVNGSGFVSLNKEFSLPNMVFDISNDAYGSNYSFGCRVNGLTGIGNYTYSDSFTKVRMNHFYLGVNPEQVYSSKTPYTLSIISELQNTVNASIRAQLADCNGDGVWDYSWNYENTTTLKARNTFTCINLKGVVDTTIGMIIYKNNSESWDTLNCNELPETDNYCIVYKTYELIVQ